MRSLAVPFVLALALALPASAQPVAPTEPAPTIVYAKKTALDFTEALIDAERAGPEGHVVWLRPNTRFRNLIELRAHFRPELARSASRLPSTVP